MPQFKVVLNTPMQLCLGSRPDPTTEERIIEAKSVAFEDGILYLRDKPQRELLPGNVLAIFAPGTWRSVERLGDPRPTVEEKNP